MIKPEKSQNFGNISEISSEKFTKTPEYLSPNFARQIGAPALPGRGKIS